MTEQDQQESTFLQIENPALAMFLVWTAVLNLTHNSYRQNVPGQEKFTILGCQYLRVEWKPSRELVCASGDICLMSITS